MTSEITVQDTKDADLLSGIFRFRFKALGSPCEVQFSTATREQAEGFKAAALHWIKNFENSYSRFLPHSELSKINSAAGQGAVSISSDMKKMLEICDMIHEITCGVMDVTSLPLIRLWDDAEKAQQKPDREKISLTLGKTGWRKVERGEDWVRLPMSGMALDFGGFGKEYAVDRIVEIGADFGIYDMLVDLGRDMATAGKPPHQAAWCIGIEDVNFLDNTLTRVALTGQAVATSGNYRRYREINGERFGHLLDPRSGMPADSDVLSASCIASTCLTAGIFSQSACILGSEKGLSLIEGQYQVAGLIQCKQQILKSKQFYQYEIPNNPQ